MIDDTDFEALKTVAPAFAQLTKSERARVVRDAARLEAPRGATLFEEESPCRAFALLTRGVLRVAKEAANGRSILLYRVEPGDVCVLTVSCLLGERDYTARGEVEADLSGVVVPRPLFQDLVSANEAFRAFVFASFARRMSELMSLVEEVAFRRLDARLAGLLVRRGPHLQATHQALADELGSVREIVSRLLKGFEEAGLLKLGRGEIEVLDATRLSALADEV